MSREIGGEFWTGCNPSDKDSAFFPRDPSLRLMLSGRTALDFVLEDLAGTSAPGKAYLPSYCCHTMIAPFLEHGYTVDFYEVTADKNGIRYGFDPSEAYDVVLLLEHFGFRNASVEAFARSAIKAGKTVIYDATHTLLLPQYAAFSFPADYVFGSVRKWTDCNLGFCMKKGSDWTVQPTLSPNHTYTEMRNSAFDMKRDYLDGKQAEKAEFLKLFSDAEDLLEREYRFRSADERSLDALQCFPPAMARKRRQENAACLTQAIESLHSPLVRCLYPTVSDTDSPLFVPLIVKADKRDELHAFLVSKGFYFPRHWPHSALHASDDTAASLYKTEISAVCDQRYSAEDMQYIADAIRSYISA